MKKTLYSIAISAMLILISAANVQAQQKVLRCLKQTKGLSPSHAFDLVLPDAYSNKVAVVKPSGDVQILNHSMPQVGIGSIHIIMDPWGNSHQGVCS